jgi:hypothetical protein
MPRRRRKLIPTRRQPWRTGKPRAAANPRARRHPSRTPCFMLLSAQRAARIRYHGGQPPPARTRAPIPAVCQRQRPAGTTFLGLPWSSGPAGGPCHRVTVLRPYVARCGGRCGGAGGAPAKGGAGRGGTGRCGTVRDGAVRLAPFLGRQGQPWLSRPAGAALAFPAAGAALAFPALTRPLLPAARRAVTGGAWGSSGPAGAPPPVCQRKVSLITKTFYCAGSKKSS